MYNTLTDALHQGKGEFSGGCPYQKVENLLLGTLKGWFEGASVRIASWRQLVYKGQIGTS